MHDKIVLHMLIRMLCWSWTLFHLSWHDILVSEKENNVITLLEILEGGGGLGERGNVIMEFYVLFIMMQWLLSIKWLAMHRGTLTHRSQALGIVWLCSSWTIILFPWPKVYHPIICCKIFLLSFVSNVILNSYQAAFGNLE